MSEKEELTRIVGKDNISDAPEELDKYAKDESPVHPVRPRCVVKPGNADEVQKIVKWANETLTPLVPVSSGSPHFRGDTVPSTDGTVIVDLGKMKNIVRIDAEHRVAMVEPGVTFGELIPELEREGIRLNMPLLPRTSKSVVGSLLEREPVIMPRYHWDIADPLACTEVIYGTGDLFRTGSAAGPGTLEEQWAGDAAQNEAAGPLQADFYRLIQGAQGTMGIVTWATVRCERLPSLEEPFLVGSSKLDDLLEFINWLIWRRLVDDCLVLNNSNLARILAKEWPREYESVKDTLFCRELDSVRVKGKSLSVKIYELLGERKDSEKWSDFVRVFDEGLVKYKQCQWDDAIACFQNATEIRSGDPPSELYIKRCRELKDNPPEIGWDGVYTMTKK